MTFVLFFLCHWAQARTVLLEAPGARDLDYQAMLSANSEYLSPSQAYLNSHPSLSHREQLVTAFAAAQTAFLQNSIVEAREKFMGLLSLLMEDDWGRDERQAFLLAYFRLAQMESEAGARDRWLGQSLLLGAGLKVDEALIPPPLVARRLELSRQIPEIDIQRTDYASGWSEVLVNGQRCLRTGCDHWTRYPGKVRVTFVSNRWLPQTLLVDSQELSSLAPKTISWAEGSCEKPRPSEKAKEFSSSKIFWNLECDKPAITVDSLRPQPSVQPALPLMKLNPQSPPIYKSKLFWGGVGLVAALILVRNSQKRDVRETTTSYGY